MLTLLRRISKNCLLKAAEEGDLNVIQLLLNLNSDINAKDDLGWTPLICAAYEGHLNVVRLLLDRHADINAKNDKGSTALIVAAQQGHLDIFRLLFDRNADINATDCNGHTALTWSALLGHLDMVQFLLDRNVGVNAKSDDGSTALIWATLKGQLDVVQLLLDQNADVNAKSDKGLTALIVAAQKGHLDVLQLLLDQNADINARDSQEWTALIWAAYDGHLNVVQGLLDRNADIKSENNDGWTALNGAACRGHLDVVQLLLDQNADVNAKANSGYTPLHNASLLGHTSVIKCLIENGADPKVKTRKGKTASSLCARYGHLDSLILLQKYQDDSDTTLFLAGAKGGHLNIMKHMFGSVQVDAMNDKGWTALHIAAYNGHIKIVKLLKLKGADLNVRTRNNETALELAVKRNHFDICEYLMTRMDKGAFKYGFNLACLLGHLAMAKLFQSNMNQNDIYESLRLKEHTPLWHACKRGDIDMVKYLLDLDASLISIKAPDETSSPFMAFIGRHHDISEYLRDKFKINTKWEDSTNLPEIESSLTRLSKDFPQYNSNVEEKEKMKLEHEIELFKISKFILGRLCPIKEYFRQNPGSQTILLKDIQLTDCQLECKKRSDCLMISDMIKSVQLIEKELKVLMPEFAPYFALVGSIAEGTRTHRADELDLTVVFEGRLYSLGRDSDGFNLWSVNDKEPFDYENFFSQLLKLVFSIINEKIDIPSITDGRIKVQQKMKECQKCPIQAYDSKIGVYYTHCDNCLPPVTHTKCGLCLIFEWSDGNETHVLTIDLVPVFPVIGSSVSELFSCVTKTLLTEPPNWLKYSRGFISKDTFLPESYEEAFKETPLKPLFVGMKIIHYGDGGRNFLIRPIQQLGVATFEDNKQLKDVYCHIKYLKTALDIDLNSYFIKKVLLTKEVKNKLKSDGKNMLLGSKMEVKNLHYCLNHPELKSRFNHVIDYEEWYKNDDVIPLL